jgi:hypothetical protein
MSSSATRGTLWMAAVLVTTASALSWSVAGVTDSLQPQAPPPTHTGAPQAASVDDRIVTGAPPPSAGYFTTQPAGAWRALPSGQSCSRRVHQSPWEPRPDNRRPNHHLPPLAKVRAALAKRPRALEGAFAPVWDSWLLPRVGGQHRGTTDENIQWAACKWGISDNVLRAIAVRESTWYEYEVYPSRRCVPQWGCGDMISAASDASSRFCAAISARGHDYERDYGRGRCPKTFSIVGVMSWQDPRWGRMAGNQNGTFPFNRDSTAFALDYLGADLRGCLEGWERFLADTGTGTYTKGRLWGCVGAWYSGDWRSPAANRYISLVKGELENRTWLKPSWSDVRPACSPTYGCPQGP